MAGYWNAHSDRDWEEEFAAYDTDYAEVAETKMAEYREEIADLKATIQRLAADVEAATKWAAAYEREHGPFEAMPAIPDFMIPF